MLNWFKTNSDFMQALAAMVSALTTVILAVLTAVYVTLTKRLTSVTQGQLNAVLDEQNAREIQMKKKLIRLYKYFEKSAKELPYDDEEFDRLASFDLWTEQEIASFQEALIANGPGSAQAAANLISAMRWFINESANVAGNPQRFADFEYRNKYRAHVNSVQVELKTLPVIFINDAWDAYKE